jgi:hypothetical protein
VCGLEQPRAQQEFRQQDRIGSAADFFVAKRQACGRHIKAFSACMQSTQMTARVAEAAPVRLKNQILALQRGDTIVKRRPVAKDP